MARITVDRCVCLGRTFADLRERAAREGLSLDQIMALPAAEKPDGRRCGTCRPYVRRCLETGQAVFHELLPPEAG